MRHDKDNCYSEREEVNVADLPFYSSSQDCSYALQDSEPGVLQEKVKEVRKELVEMFILAKQKFYAGVALSSTAYKHITKEDNLPARVGIITGGGLLGLAVGIARGRLARRLVYPMVGAIVGAAISYPLQAREVRDKVIQEGRINIMEAYNRLSGVSTKKSVSDISSQASVGLIVDLVQLTIILVQLVLLKLLLVFVKLANLVFPDLVETLYEVWCEWDVKIKPLLETTVDNEEEKVLPVDVPKVKVTTNENLEVSDEN